MDVTLTRLLYSAFLGLRSVMIIAATKAQDSIGARFQWLRDIIFKENLPAKVKLTVVLP